MSALFREDHIHHHPLGRNYDIEVVGLCKNGMETYDMIMDESTGHRAHRHTGCPAWTGWNLIPQGFTART